MVTKQVIAELKRTLVAMETYQKGHTEEQYGVNGMWRKCEPYWPNPDQTHSSAFRASMDLTKILAKWRQTGKPYPGRAK